MLIERTNTEVIIRIPSSVNTEDLQVMLNYIRYKEIVTKFKISQKKVDALAKKVQKDWWSENRKRFIK